MPSNLFVWCAFATILLFSLGCTEISTTMDRIMKREGITEWHETGYAPFSCSRDETFSTGFEGIKNGVKVSGAVCSGWFAGHVVRYE